MPNIILNDRDIRTVNLYQENEYQLSDLYFYIPNEFDDYTILVILNDSEGLNEICKLQYIEQATNYKIYTFDPFYQLRVQSGEVSIYLLLIDNTFTNTKITNSITVNIGR